MSDYVLSCCSTIDLNKELVEKDELHVIPFHYFLGDKEHVDDFGQTIPYDEFYKRMVDGEMTKTSQVNVEEYVKYFEKILKEGKDILHLTLSGGLSGTINSANIAKGLLKEEYPQRKIIIIDSLAASSGYGLLMHKLACMKANGKTIEEVANWAEQHKLDVNHWFFSSDLTFYVRGGRVSKVSGFVGTVLKICPLLNVDYKGHLIPREKIRTKSKAIQEIVKKMEENVQNGYNYDGDVFISHSACLEDAQEIAKLVESKFKKINGGKVQIFDIGTTIGSHTGPGTCALYFFGNKRIN
jgi:DegV family protein with EDD domain